MNYYTKLIISSLFLFSGCFILKITAQTLSEFSLDTQNTIENYLKHSDHWGIVIDSQFIRISEKEDKKNLTFSSIPEIKLQKQQSEGNAIQRDKKKIVVKTFIRNDKTVKNDSAALSSSQSFSDSLQLNPDSSTLNYDTIHTINYDDSRTINIDNNRDINKGKDMNKNRDRSRDLRRDLKRDKSRDRGRDMKRDKNRDRGGQENAGNRFKIKIYY